MFRARFATSPSDVIEKLNLNLRDIEAELARRPQAGPAATKPQSLPIPSPSAVRHDATAGIDEGNIKHMTAAWVSGLTGGGSTALHSHSQYMLAAMRGAVNGVCELDANSLIPIGRVPASLLGGVRYQGVWSATTNTPTLATSPDSTTKGFYYKVSVAGTWNSISWAIGDWIISSGTSWDKVDNTDQVTSVFGRQGAVTAQAGDYTAAQVGAEPAVTAGLVSQFWSGLKTWRDLAADVRAVVLTGLSTATNSAIAATDSILVALGKLQAQINVRLMTVTGDTTSRTANTVYAAPNGSAGTATFRTLVATDLPTVTVVKGGTGKTTWAAFSTLYASAANVLAELAPNTTATKKFLRMTGTGSAGATPAWDTVTASDVGLGNVNNTADIDKPVSTAVSNALEGKLSFSGYPKQIGGATYATDYFLTQTDLTRGLSGQYYYYLQDYEVAIIANDWSTVLGKAIVQIAFTTENGDYDLTAKVVSGDFSVANRVFWKAVADPTYVRVNIGIYMGPGTVAAAKLIRSNTSIGYSVAYFDTLYAMGGTKVYGTNEHHCGVYGGEFTSSGTVSVTPNLFYRIYPGVNLTLSTGLVPNGSEVCFVGSGCSNGSSTVNGVTFSWPTRYLSLRYFDGQWLHNHPA